MPIHNCTKEELLQKLESLYPRPSWVRGAVTVEDAQLFIEIVKKNISGPMIELGVASGWSSVILLSLFDLVPPCDGVWLHSYDIVSKCYFDTNRRVGEVVDEVVPHLKTHWQFNIGGGLEIGRAHADNPVGMAFIDADHRHPYATIDLIAMLPALKPDAWVVFHDINLPEVTSVEANKVYGPKFLFDGWPWEKIMTDFDNANMGAVKLPGDHAKVREFCISLLLKPWEVAVADDILSQLDLLGYKPEETIL